MKTSIPSPTKEQVRHWLADQIKEHKPIPTPEQVRRQLGWYLASKPH